mmetsp:Transcript_2866/g.6574  ORF Transcript_2866/g.6574 Transcript_2866/m.6574 type:complete len:211 (-) Transcript_2866:7-639(-)
MDLSTSMAADMKFWAHFITLPMSPFMKALAAQVISLGTSTLSQISPKPGRLRLKCFFANVRIFLKYLWKWAMNFMPICVAPRRRPLEGASGAVTSICRFQLWKVCMSFMCWSSRESTMSSSPSSSSRSSGGVMSSRSCRSSATRGMRYSVRWRFIPSVLLVLSRPSFMARPMSRPSCWTRGSLRPLMAFRTAFFCCTFNNTLSSWPGASG